MILHAVIIVGFIAILFVALEFVQSCHESNNLRVEASFRKSCTF